jgi:hypothetical protein
VSAMTDLPEYINGLPNISGREQLCAQAMSANNGNVIYLHESGIDFGRIRSAGTIALHMHQPLIPAGGSNRQLDEQSFLGARLGRCVGPYAKGQLTLLRKSHQAKRPSR